MASQKLSPQGKRLRTIIITIPIIVASSRPYLLPRRSPP